MKRKLAAIFLVLMAVSLFGCATVNVTMTPETEEILVEVTARRLAYHVALKMPAVIDPGIQVCDAVLAGSSEGDPNKAIATVITYLGQQLNDPLIEQDVKDLMRLMQFDIQMTDEQLAKMRYVTAAAKGIRLGLEMARAKNGTK